MTDFWSMLWMLTRAAALIVGAWILGGWLRGILARVLERSDPTLRAFLAGAVRPLTLIIAIPPAMDVLGIAISSFIALLSTAGLAIAIALKDSLSNVASGAILLTTRPFHVGDQVTVSGVTGRVVAIGILTTEIEADDGRRINITNDKVLSLPMERHAAEGRARVEVLLRVPAQTVGDGAFDRLRAAADSVPGAEVRSDSVVPQEFEGEQVRVAVRVWVDAARASEARAALFMAIRSATGAR